MPPIEQLEEDGTHSFHMGSSGGTAESRAEYVNPYAGMTQDELEAQFTKEDFRYPARKAASEALHTFTSEWIDEYEFDNGEGGYHTPTEFERFLIHDAFAGLTSDEEYRRLDAAWRSLCGYGDPAAAADALSASVLGIVGELIRLDPSPDSAAGRLLDKLADAVETYEKATLPPPLGNAAPTSA